MGNCVSISFIKKDKYPRESVSLFSNWQGLSLVKKARDYLKKLKSENKDNRQILPLDRLEPNTVMVDFIRYITEGKDRVKDDIYLGKDENDGDNIDKGHYQIDVDEP